MTSGRRKARMGVDFHPGRRGTGWAGSRAAACRAGGGPRDGFVRGDPAPAGTPEAAPGEKTDPSFLFCHILKALAHPWGCRRTATPLRQSREPRWREMRFLAAPGTPPEIRARDSGEVTQRCRLASSRLSLKPCSG